MSKGGLRCGTWEGPKCQRTERDRRRKRRAGRERRTGEAVLVGERADDARHVGACAKFRGSVLAVPHERRKKRTVAGASRDCASHARRSELASGTVIQAGLNVGQGCSQGSLSATGVLSPL